MDENNVVAFIAIILVMAVLFLILREFSCWYWKINERLSTQHKTNLLLERMLMQLGASDLDEISIEEIATGKIKKAKIDDWLDYKTKKGKTNGFRMVKSTEAPEKI